jgi:peptidoglycan/xylan/chitin deacetylase (PgdA/CDA1 family)
MLTNSIFLFHQERQLIADTKGKSLPLVEDFLMSTSNRRETPSSEWVLSPQSRTLNAGMWTAAKLGGGLQQLLGNCCSEGFGILMYHRIAEHNKKLAAPTLNVTPDQFRRQIGGLRDLGFECWPLSKLVAAHVDARPIPINAFAITFDDGYENNYSHASPILRELNVPATVFVATQYLDTDQPFPFDTWSEAGSERAARSAWGSLSSDQCREMLDSGFIELGAHTHSHRRFVGHKREYLRDMQLCLDVLRDQFGVVRPTFAFPYGEMDDELVEATRQLDLSCAVTVRQRRVRPGDDLFRWGRFHVGPRDTPTMLAGKLSGWYPSFIAASKAVLRPWRTMARVARRPHKANTLKRANADASLTGSALSQS